MGFPLMECVLLTQILPMPYDFQLRVGMSRPRRDAFIKNKDNMGRMPASLAGH